MPNYNDVLSSINLNIKENTSEDITATIMNLTLKEILEFANTHNITAWYKPLALRFMIWRYRERSERTLRANGFKMYRDVDTDVKLWVRIPEECSTDTVLYFLHGFGMGVPPYTSFIEK